MKFFQNHKGAMLATAIVILTVTVILMYTTETVTTAEGTSVQRFKFLN